MTKQLRRVALGMFVLFLALFVNLNYLHVLRAEELSENPLNSRGLIREYQTRRGLMIAGDGETEVATSTETDGNLRFLRGYTDGPLYAHLTGYYSFIYGRAELEREFNDFLVGSAPELFADNIADLLAGRERAGDDLRLTVQPAVQQAAREALGDRRGAVVALEPLTGRVLALWSNPSYDPNRLSSHDQDEVNAYWDELQQDPNRPLINRAVRETYPPGSTFKLVTAAAALEAGVTPETAYDDPQEQELPQTTATIGNFGGGTCNGGSPISLAQALQVSCNTTFAQIGLQLGPERLVTQAQRFGFNSTIIEQVPSPADSRMPTELNPPQTAQSAIGQFDVAATPLQMALVSAAIGNGGVLMTPRVVEEVTDERSQPVTEFGPQPLTPGGLTNSQAVSTQTAQRLTEMMIAVVAQGTGTGAQIAGVEVAGKTGTAQVGEGRPPTVWFTGFAPARNPRVAVAVVIEEGGGVGDEATGGALAAPVARAVMEAALASAGQVAPAPTGEPTQQPGATPTSAPPRPTTPTEAPTEAPTED